MNLFDPRTPTQGESFTTLLEHKNIKIIRIVSSSNLEPIEYIQDEDEWVVVIEGLAKLNINGQSLTLNKGQSHFIPAQTPHNVQSVQNGTIWLAVHIS